MRLVSFRELYLSQFFISLFPAFSRRFSFFAFSTKLPLLTGIQYDVVLVWSSHRDKPKAHGIAKVLCGIEQKQEPAQAIKRKRIRKFCEKLYWKTLQHIFFFVVVYAIFRLLFVVCSGLVPSFVVRMVRIHTHSYID